MNSLKTEKINQFLRQRKIEMKKVNMYRNKRIKHRYEKVVEQQTNRQIARQENVENSNDQKGISQKRKIQFYNQVFSNKSDSNQKNSKRNSQDYHKDKWGRQDKINRELNNADEPSSILRKDRGSFNIPQNSGKQNKTVLPNIQQNQTQKLEKKFHKLKQRKKKFIKKMDQRTNKGQPVMKNYIKYALTKIQQGMVKQKLGKEKIKEDQNAKQLAPSIFKGGKNNFSSFKNQKKSNFRAKH